MELIAIRLVVELLVIVIIVAKMDFAALEKDTISTALQ